MGEPIDVLASLGSLYRNLNSRAVNQSTVPISHSDVAAVDAIFVATAHLINAAESASRMRVRGDLAKVKQRALRDALARARGRP